MNILNKVLSNIFGVPKNNKFGKIALGTKHELAKMKDIKAIDEIHTKEERIIEIYNYLSSSLIKEWRDPFYDRVSFDLLVLIVDYIENQQGKIITMNNALTKLVAFCKENRYQSGFEIYEKVISQNKFFHKKTTSFVAITSLALKYLSENEVNNAYSNLKSLIIATLADNKELNDY